MLKSRAGEVLRARIDEQFRDAHVASNREPRSQAGGNSFPEGKDALLPSFSHHTDIHVARTKRCIADFESDQFGNAKSASERQVKHGAVADAITGAGIWS